MKEFTSAVLRYLGTTKVLRAPRKYFGEILTYYYSVKDVTPIKYNNNVASNKISNLIKQIKKEVTMHLFDIEAFQICVAVQKTKKISGDIAEVGVYQGGSAKLICEGDQDRQIYLCDTFEGLPDLSEGDNPNQFYKGQYYAAFENVRNYLKNYSNIDFYKGFFPSSAEPLKNKVFSFVHLDVDIYESTLNCLKFFYSRMNKGGIILVHDYPNSDGVKRACDEFFSDKKEIIIEQPGCRQVLIVKV